MQKWEYFWFEDDWHCFDSEKQKLKLHDSNAMNGSEYLAYLGELGWELVGMHRKDTDSTSVRFFLKRPKAQ